MSRKYYIIFTGVFLALCAILGGGVWYSLSELYAYREEYDRLVEEGYSNYEVIGDLESENALLVRISKLGVNNYEPVSDAVEFFSLIRPIIDSHNINLLYITTSGKNSSRKSNTLQLKINGKYYDMVNMFADFRSLTAPSKITRLNLRRNNEAPEELIEADLTIEVMTEE